MIGFTQIASNTTFYMQDIDSNILSKKVFDKKVKQCIKLNQANKFRRVIGAVNYTNLPDNSFDKIILVSTLHEFTYMKEIILDIYSKLKPNGKLYVLETHCLSHKNTTVDESVDVITKQNFTLLKKDGAILMAPKDYTD
jgi:ubiquinone/menaquinone biosynthesis C-methylase UbiE